MSNRFSESNLLSRRAIFKNALAGLAAIPVVSIGTAQAESLPHLGEQDPQAKALGYVDDVAKVDAKSNPTYKAGQDCANCLQLQGKAGDAYRPCNLFPGKLVSAKGWCKAYVKKP